MAQTILDILFASTLEYIVKSFFCIGQVAAQTTTGNHTRIGTYTLRPGECTVGFSWVARNRLQVFLSSMSLASVQRRGCSTSSAAAIRVGFASQDLHSRVGG